MSDKLLDTLKPIKYIGNTFGFIPLCLDKNHKNFREILILNLLYSLILILLMLYVLHFDVTVAITWFREASMMPDILHQIIQALPMTISILHVIMSLVHQQKYFELLENFNKIDTKVNFI